MIAATKKVYKRREFGRGYRPIIRTIIHVHGEIQWHEMTDHQQNIVRWGMEPGIPVPSDLTDEELDQWLLGFFASGKAKKETDGEG